MEKVKGNTLCVIQTATFNKTNAIGEKETVWQDTHSFMSVLSMQTSDSKYSTFNAKIEESSHVIVCDFNSEIYALKDQNTRIVANGRMYDVLFIDNPDELNIHLEIYLRYVGGQNVS